MSDNVVEFGSWQIRRSHERRLLKKDECDHKSIELDGHGDIARCTKCNAQVSAMWVLRMICDEYEQARSKVRNSAIELEEAKRMNRTLLATREVEKAWRSTKMAPTCPHCGRGILNTDGFGRSRINIALEMRRREREATARAAAQGNPAPTAPVATQDE